MGLARLWSARQFSCRPHLCRGPAPDKFRIPGSDVRPYPNIMPVHTAISHRSILRIVEFTKCVCRSKLSQQNSMIEEQAPSFPAYVTAPVWGAILILVLVWVWRLRDSC